MTSSKVSDACFRMALSLRFPKVVLLEDERGYIAQLPSCLACNGPDGLMFISFLGGDAEMMLQKAE